MENSTLQLKTRHLVGLIVSLVICFMAAGIGGAFTSSSVDGWYKELSKPSWNPPGWVFGPVWTVLYFMMGVSAWLVWKDSGIEKTKWALSWFGFHLILNVLWSVLFFGLQLPGWACFEIILLWFSIVVTIFIFLPHSKLAAILLTPYLLWVSFATYLNFIIWALNNAG